jgi:DnaK suppressor protein
MMNRERTETLRELLNHLRNTELMRVRQLRHEQEGETLTDPGDDMEIARAQTQTELHASLIERSGQRLRAIDGAFSRLGSGEYGTCGECGEEIPPQRLKLLPFVLLCVDCQGKMERTRGSRPSNGKTVERWESGPDGGNAENPKGLADVNSDDSSEFASAFVFDDDLESEPPTQPRRSGRPRKNAGVGSPGRA